MKIRTLIIAMLACILMTSNAAQAATWRVVSVSKDGTIWYVDKSSVREVKEGYPASTVKKVWVKADFSSVKSQEAREAKILAFFKCDDEMAKTTTWVTYKPDGSLLRDLSSSYPVYKPVIPETNLRAIFDEVCYPKDDWSTDDDSFGNGM